MPAPALAQATPALCVSFPTHLSSTARGYKCAYTRATWKTEELDTGAASAAVSAGPAAAPTDDALLSYWPALARSYNKQSTAFEVVPITTYNTVRGFGFQTKSSSPIISLCSWQWRCYYYFCLPPPRPRDRQATQRLRRSPPPLYGKAVGPLSIASVQRTTHKSHSVWTIAHTSISSKLPHTCSTRESAYSLLLN
jgi:hypothetical protein